MLQITRTPRVFDVVVVGSGAGGGTAVKVLTDQGINVTLLEAGPMLNPQKDFQEHVLPYQVDHRGAGGAAELYFGRQQWNYFAAPNGPAAERSYALLREVMKRSGRIGIAKVILREREDVIAISPNGDGLMIQKLHYRHEVRSVADVPGLSLLFSGVWWTKWPLHRITK